MGRLVSNTTRAFYPNVNRYFTLSPFSPELIGDSEIVSRHSVNGTTQYGIDNFSERWVIVHVGGN